MKPSIIPAPPVPSSGRADRLEALDVLRIVAALGVIVFHAADIAGLPTVLPDFAVAGHNLHGVRTPIGLGATGVSLFFVLSGCVLMRQWLLAGGLRPAVFVRNRIARIVPAYEAALVLSVIVGVVVNGFSADYLTRQTVVHAVFAQGFHPLWFLALNAPLWSMATEMQFYAVFLGAAAWLKRVGWHRFLFWAAVITLVCRVAAGWLPSSAGPATWTSLVRYQLPGRFLEFALGMALASAAVGTTSLQALVARCRVAFVLLLAPALTIRWLGPSVLADPMMGVLYAAACGAVLTSTAPASWPPLVWRALTSLGRASYSIFLIHDPTLKVLGMFGRRVIPEGAPLFALLLAGVPVVIGAGLLLHHLVERPMWRRLHVSASGS